jgi:exopolysaccharide biosynthesis polyprenyl glycosylphosphotransferase
LKLFGDRRYGTRRILIIGTGVVGQQVAEMVYQNSWTGLKLVGFVDDSPHATINYPYLGSLEQTVNIVKQERINEVVFALPRQAHHKLANLVAELEHVKINMRVVPDFLDLVFLRSVVEDFGGVPLITIHEPALDPLQRFIKRCFDLVMASIMILPGIPLMILIAIFIKLDSLGPIIFAQQRVGQHGRFFEMYKFRTMYHNSSEVPANLVKKLPSGETTHKFADDPRVTRIGKFLRRTSLDELPQLLNVIKGDMSLVGPRPELPWLVEEYEPWQRKRFEVPQGITGWWQVNGRSTKLMHLHTEEDLYYIKNYSIWLDLQILWRTVKVVISQYGAF